jgi:RNA polymerase sporulation-specific sigma factor
MTEHDRMAEPLPAPSTADYTDELPQLEPPDEAQWLTAAATRAINRTIDGDAAGEELGQLFETYRATGEGEELIGVAFEVVALVGLHYVNRGALTAREVLEAAPQLIIDTAEGDNVGAETYVTQLADATEEFCAGTAEETDVTDGSHGLTQPEAPAGPRFDRGAFNRLARRAKQGDAHATNQLMSESAKWARIIIGKNGYYIPGGEGEDISQDALMGVVRALRDYDPAKGSFATLAEIAIKRGIYTSIKQANRGKHTPLNNAVDLHSPFAGTNTEGGPPLLDALPNPSSHSPETKVLEKERLRALPHLLNRLSTLERNVTLLEAGGLTYAQVAQTLEVDIKTVDNALQRATKKLAKAGIEDFAETVTPPPPPDPEEDLLDQHTEHLRARREKSALQKAEGTLVNADELFTPRESLILVEMAHHGTLEQLSKKLEVSATTLSRITQPARERLGVKTILEFMLYGIAAGVTDISHVPEGMTDFLNDKDRALLATRYSPNPEIATRSYERDKKMGHRYSRMYDKLGLEKIDSAAQRWQTVLYAVKDGIIELPDIAELKSR